MVLNPEDDPSSIMVNVQWLIFSPPAIFRTIAALQQLYHSCPVVAAFVHKNTNLKFPMDKFSLHFQNMVMPIPVVDANNECAPSLRCNSKNS